MQPKPLRLLAPVAVLACVPFAFAGEDGYGDQDATKLFTRAMSVPGCAPTDDHECGAPCEEAYSASKQLGALLVKQPAAFETVAPLFRAGFEESEQARTQVLGFLSSCGTDPCVALGEELYAAAPTRFTEAQVLAFAEAGSETMIKSLLAKVRSGQTRTALPAAWFALTGEPAGKKTLKRALGAEVVDAASAREVLISGAALAALGYEDALDKARGRVHASVLTALDEGRLEQARSMALTAEALSKSLDKAAAAATYGKAKGKVRLSGLAAEAGWHCKQRSADVVSADAVFVLIERVTPLS